MSGLSAGDRAFDGAHVVRGDTLVLAPLLDAETRTALTAFCRAGGEIAEGQLRLESQIPVVEVDRAEAAVREAVAVARRLAPPDDPAAKLAQIALRDPEPGVRRSCLELLAGSFPETAGTLATLRAATSDADPWVRLTAARDLGPEGHATLVALATDHETTPKAALEAMEALGSGCPAEPALRHLELALSNRRLDAARTATRALGRGASDQGRARLDRPRRAVSS